MDFNKEFNPHIIQAILQRTGKVTWSSYSLFKTKAEFHTKTGDNKECNSNLDYYQSTWNVKCSKEKRESELKQSEDYSSFETKAGLLNETKTNREVNVKLDNNQ